MLTIENFKKECGVHITLNHSGKMSGMVSLSTSALNNPFCKAYAKDCNKICSKCYACTQLKRYKSQNEVLIKNSEVLTSQILPMEKLPFMNCAFFRFEAFGDIANETQVINYFNISKVNPHCNFALWSKNPFIIKNVIDSGIEKPENLNIIHSSPYINKKVDIEELHGKGYTFIDKVFSVYDKETIERENINVNCGAKSCIGCRLCYEKNNVVYINEKLK